MNAAIAALLLIVFLFGTSLLVLLFAVLALLVVLFLDRPIDGNRPAVDFLAVDAGNSLLSIGTSPHKHETETSHQPTLLPRDVSLLDLAIAQEELLQLLGVLDRPGQVANDQFRRLPRLDLLDLFLSLVLGAFLALTVSALSDLNTDLLALDNMAVELCFGALGVFGVGECDETVAAALLGRGIVDGDGVLDGVGVGEERGQGLGGGAGR